MPELGTSEIERVMAYDAMHCIEREGLSRPQSFALCVFLPDAVDGLWALEERMASSPEGFLHDHLPENENLVDVESRVLDRSRMLEVEEHQHEDRTSGEPFFLNDMLHKAAIVVDEVSAQALPCDDAWHRCWPPTTSADFVVDHPFAFFAGHVLDS
ncbi:hypothetical protein QOZ80_5AG0372850 [Eleusine coracana subsp. coracana]|nr:hypothetical protein QOZ80_5AG0372850 [Eleusine coracana subsp. coracana]